MEMEKEVIKDIQSEVEVLNERLEAVVADRERYHNENLELKEINMRLNQALGVYKEKLLAATLELNEIYKQAIVQQNRAAN